MNPHAAARALLVTLALLAFTAARARAGDLPRWLEAARAAPVKSSTAGAHAIVLFHERQVTCVARGRNVVVDRGALRVLDRRAAHAARVAVYYERASASVRDLEGWLVGADGRVTPIGEGSAVDVSDAGWGSLKTDQRSRQLSVPDAAPGTLFGWEWTVEEEALFADQRFTFGNEYPTVLERFRLVLPKNVEPRVTPFGSGVPKASLEANTWTWERRDIPAIPDEPASASGPSWLDWFVVSPVSSPGTPPMPGRVFEGWPDVARWVLSLAELDAPQPPEVSAAASVRVAGASSSIEQARGLARSVQAVNYVSVSVGLARGEGYRPHTASDVLRSGYGDCKDKANLFCALARAAGLEAWPVMVSTRGRDHVRPEWPSPWQFDHCIAALRVPAGTPLPAVADTTPLGPLLFFDGTDPLTPLGGLPEVLQGSWALIQHPAKGALVRLPIANAGQSRAERKLQGTIDSTGALTAAWSTVLRGGPARRERNAWTEGERAWRERLDRTTSDWLGSNRIERLIARDEPDSDAFRFQFDVRAERYGRSMGRNLLALRTTAPAAPDAWETSDTARSTPIALPARSSAESVVLKLPSGWRVDELPAPVSQERDFGAFDARWAAAGDSLTFTLTTRVVPVTLPASRHRELLAFAESLRRVRRTQVVLARD